MRSDTGTPQADVIAPLRYLTRQQVAFNWTAECQNAFKELKRRLSHRTVLMPYKPNLETRLYVDHGPVGFASTLAQNHAVNETPKWKAINHMSRNLVKAK